MDAVELLCSLKRGRHGAWVVREIVSKIYSHPFQALKAARSLAERSLVEIILEQQSSGQLTASLWAAVRARGCQFLGPAMQEEVLKLVLLALEDGSALSRKVFHHLGVIEETSH